jgi:starch phosphorylase
LGFARRFATYKRPNLLLADTQRLIRILTNPARPVQLIVAGKAHPQDEPAKEMVEEWIRFVRRPELRSQVAFLTDYDLVLAEAMVGGVDLWLNTPRRPMEACGTSGMKVLVNGGLNLSELDGWWDEAYAPEVGWALGDGQFHDDDPAWDAAEADALYRILEEEAIPCFYQRNAEGIPTAWVAKMRESMARLAPRFSANRTLREYTESYYLVAAKAYRRRAEAGGRLGEKVLAWQREVARCWAGIHFGNVRVQTFADHHQFDLQVYLGELDPDSVEVQLYADRPGTDGCVRHTMTRAEPLVGAAKGWSYTAQVPAERPAEDFTPRVIPRNADVAIPLEAPQIKWQR